MKGALIRERLMKWERWRRLLVRQGQVPMLGVCTSVIGWLVSRVLQRKLSLLQGELIFCFAGFLITHTDASTYTSTSCVSSQHNSIPRVNYESFQLLHYDKKQFYRSHHDSSRTDDTPAGHRILTFFLYLTDVEEGGETHFNKLGLSIKPKKGRALVWPSVLDENPELWDSRMYHEAKDVIKGEKRAANHWIHLNDYITPNDWGCTGSFS
mmetsp:Transcript_19459/g.42303  ORF Transcript_19459/g.42303 Transcript_19459/m.42303 type:complete len:210 (+) Transcript_19459:864-1493(+)